MKFFIYLCCLTHFLTEISARLWLTTPMQSELRSNDDAARQASNIGKMIDFINSVNIDDGLSIARSGRYDPTLRRFELPVVQGVDIPPSVVVPSDEDTENQLEKVEDTARYHVIDNPEVLEEYSNKQKLKNVARLLNPVPVVSETSPEAKAFSTVENKLRYYHSKSKSAALHKGTESNTFHQSHHISNPNPFDGLQKLSTIERTYRPSFSDDDDNNNKLITEDIEVTFTEKEINTPRVEANNYVDNTEKQPEINDTINIERRTVDNKALDKGDQARIEEEKAQVDDTKEIGDKKQELPLKTEKYNDGVTVVEEKSESYKEYITTKIDHNSNERQNEDSIHSRGDEYKNYGNTLINGTTVTNSEKDMKPRERSWDKNKVFNVPVERLIGRIDKSALKAKRINNHDHKEHHSTFKYKELNENSHKRFKNRHEKIEKYGRKKKDKNDDGWSKKEKDWNKIERYNKDIGYDRMEYEWNKRHQQYDENDNLDMSDNQWNKDNDFNSRDYDSDKRDDDWDKRDNDSNKRDKDWIKKQIDSNKRDSDWNIKEIDSNIRDNDWYEIANAWIKQESKPYKDNRNKNGGDLKQNEWDNKYSESNVENDTDTPDSELDSRYEIVDRKRTDGDFNQRSEV